MTNTAWFLALVADRAGGAAAPAYALSGWRIAILFLIFAALLGLSWKLNRGQGGLGLGFGFRRLLQPGAAKILIHERKWIDSRTSVSLVEAEGERFLLAQSHGTIAWQPLAKRTNPKNGSIND